MTRSNVLRLLGVLLSSSILLSYTSRALFSHELQETYDCVNYSENVIDNSDALKSFFDKLNSLSSKKREKVRIAHIGDSHIQADYLTHRTRTLLQKSFGNGGRGFIFPYRLIRSNSPVNVRFTRYGEWEGCVSTSYRTKCNFGLTGASALTYDDSASIKIDPNRLGDMNYEFDHMLLYHFRTPNSYNVKFLDEDSAEMTCDVQPVSKTVSRVHFNSVQDSLWLAFNKDSQQYFHQLFGVSLENSNRGLIYDAIGLNGAHAASYLRNQFFDEQLATLDPDLVIISLGTNDGYMPSSRFCKGCFKDNYRVLLRKVKSNNPDVCILLTTPGDYYRRRRYHDRNQAQVIQAIKELAREEGLAVWDFNEIMGGKYSVKRWVSSGLARRDLIHYSEEGYLLQGELLYHALISAYEKQSDDDIIPQ